MNTRTLAEIRKEAEVMRANSSHDLDKARLADWVIDLCDLIEQQEIKIAGINERIQSIENSIALEKAYKDYK